MLPTPISFFFFFNDTATTEIYTLSLHDALPISIARYYTPSGRLIQRDYKSISLLEYYERKIPEHPTEVRLTDSGRQVTGGGGITPDIDRKSTRLNSSHGYISYAVFCLKKKSRCAGMHRAPIG